MMSVDDRACSPGAASGRRRRGARARVRGHGRDRAPEAARARPQPRRALPLRRASGRRLLGAALLDRRLGREHAGLQLLLPAAALHAHAHGLAELVRARRLPRHGGGRERARRRSTPPRDASLPCWPRSRNRCSRTGASRSSSKGSHPRSRGRCRPTGHGSSWAPARRTARIRSSPATRRVGSIELEGQHAGTAAARRRLLPALGSLVGVAVDRERLAREAVEAEALRRSDALKTAVLRAVSHDLRTPLMAILTAASALSRRDLDLESSDRTELLGDHPRRGRAARPAGRQPARPLAAAGRSGAPRARAMGDRRPRGAGARGGG